MIILVLISSVIMVFAFIVIVIAIFIAAWYLRTEPTRTLAQEILAAMRSSENNWIKGLLANNITLFDIPDIIGGLELGHIKFVETSEALYVENGPYAVIADELRQLIRVGRL